MSQAKYVLAFIASVIVAIVMWRHQKKTPVFVPGAIPDEATVKKVLHGDRRAKPPATQPLPAMPIVRRPIAILGWGTASNQAGRRHDPESQGEGPMAITMGRDGTAYILDQVNGRVLRRKKDGSFATPIPVASDTAQDLRADDRGITLLDRLGEHVLRRYDTDGKVLEEKTLASIGIDNPSTATGLFETSDDALYVERSVPGEGRRELVPVAGGAPLPGRPSSDGTLLISASIVSRSAGTLLVRATDRTGSARFEATLSVGRMIMSIILLDTDSAGGIYVGVTDAAVAAPPSHDLVDEKLDLFRLDGTGAVVAHTNVDHPPSGLETFRELCVAGVGIVDWMHALPDGSGITVDEIRL